MSLYIVETRQIQSRKANWVFYSAHNGWFLHSKGGEEPLFAKQGIADIPSILSFAQKKGFKEFEISLSLKEIDDETFVKSLKELDDLFSEGIRMRKQALLSYNEAFVAFEEGRKNGTGQCLFVQL